MTAVSRGSVSPALTIAALTMKEALRRKLVLAFLVITVAVVGLSAWGFYRISHRTQMTSGEVSLALPTAYILFMFMFSFVVALSASAIASPAVSSEIDSGVLHAMVARPVRRGEILLGKWLGLAALLAGYTAVVGGLEYAVVDWSSGYLPPDPIPAAAFLFAEGAVLLTLVLLLSTRLATLAAGVIGVALFGIAWLAGRRRGAGQPVPHLRAGDGQQGRRVRGADRRPVARGHLLPGTTRLRAPAGGDPGRPG